MMKSEGRELGNKKGRRDRRKKERNGNKRSFGKRKGRVKGMENMEWEIKIERMSILIVFKLLPFSWQPTPITWLP